NRYIKDEKKIQTSIDKLALYQCFIKTLFLSVVFIIFC
ncbi:hypothetical protein M089_3231, partial [Bacteroides ovatus str. 3725 D9 iii]